VTKNLRRKNISNMTVIIGLMDHCIVVFNCVHQFCGKPFSAACIAVTLNVNDGLESSELNDSLSQLSGLTFHRGRNKAYKTKDSNICLCLWLSLILEP